MVSDFNKPPSVRVETLIFSEGTYQVQLLDREGGAEYWPFIQLDDEGNVCDAFCSCLKGERCEHLAVAYRFLVHKEGVPLHVHFRASLWNVVCREAASRCGCFGDLLHNKEGGYEVLHGGALVFRLSPKEAHAHAFCREYLEEREEETEETSIKFSNLSEEEIARWRAGSPSFALSYELSFWADIAKYCFLRQVFGERHAVDLAQDERGVLYALTADYISADLHWDLSQCDWDALIPSLKTVQTPFPVHDAFSAFIETIAYDRSRGAFLIRARAHKPMHGQEGARYGRYSYTPSCGFVPKEQEPLLRKEVIEHFEIERFLTAYSESIKHYLVEETIHSGTFQLQHHLFFDADHALCIQAYLFEPGDVQRARSKVFGQWVYIENEGFYRVEKAPFSGVQTRIPKEAIGDFVEQSKQWLNQHKGFHIHLSSIETRILYTLDAEETLRFAAQASVETNGKDAIDLGAFIYVRGEGFYRKNLRRGEAILRDGYTIAADEISAFIDRHREDLETIRGFFADECPIARAGVDVLLSAKGIEITPRLSFKEAYRGRSRIFGKYTYVEGEGFFPIPRQWRTPSKYSVAQTIKPSQEAYFITCELAKLKPYILKLDPRLTEPKKLRLKVRKLQKKRRKWEVGLYYESELGKVGLGDILEGMAQRKEYLTTRAGLLSLSHSRFQWIVDMGLAGETEDTIRLSTLALFKLITLENIKPPQSQGREAEECRTYMSRLLTFQVESEPDLSLLKSMLRPYQILGAKWLWFLYTNGLSGLLCDEMGLGKTHQAMALLAASKAEAPNARFLVVCPTSVLYHWEELLHTYLPSVGVHVYYGSMRHLPDRCDVLLTSYGTLRAEKKRLPRFDVAIFDEVQAGKNRQSQTHKALLGVRAHMRLALTGTPIENRLMELKALFDIALPSYLPSAKRYREAFVTPIEKEGDADKKRLLKKLIAPFLLRRKKTEVLKELPDKIEEVVHARMSDEQKALYREVVLRNEARVGEQIERGDSVHVFALLNKLKRICNHPALDLGASAYQQHQSGKWELFVELLGEIQESGQKLVVFSQYLEMLDIIEAHLKESGIGFAAIRGATRDRRKELKRFKEDPDCKVFVASLRAVGVGVDLVAASVVIHYDRWWNPAVEEQASDRVHRIGQKRGVHVLKLVTKNSVEEHIDALIEKKKGLLRDILSYDEAHYAKTLTRKDLEALLRHIHSDIETD